MRNQWLNEHVGDEAKVRPEFEAQLGKTLQSAWRQPAGSVAGRPSGPSGPSRRVQVAIWAAAAAALLIGGAVVLSERDNTSVTPTTDAASVSTSAAPATAVTVETTLAPSTSEATTTTDGGPTSPSLWCNGDVCQAPTVEQLAVRDYLLALSEARFDDAAMLLGQGGLALEERSDLRPLRNSDGHIPDLAAALRAWCEQPAICRGPNDLSGEGSIVTATYIEVGGQRTTTFVGSTFEGAPAVQGLPLQLPEGISLADTVQCPAQPVDDSVYADLDGDGWFETVTLTEGLSGDYKMVTACGTSLAVPEFAIAVLPGTFPTGLFSIDIEGDGTDELLAATFDPDGFTAMVVKYDGEALVATGQVVSLSAIRGESFGCVDLVGDGLRELVNYTYSFVGGSDLSNSTALEYEATGNVDASTGGQLALPEDEEAAFRLIAGYCGNFPTQTG